MEEEEYQDEFKEEKELLDRAVELKDKLGLSSIDTALLILIQQELENISFHNSD